MAMVCRVCTHDELEAIDRALVSGAAANALASRYGLSEAAVRRHKANHLPAALVAAQEAADVAQADSLLAQLRALLAKADEQYAIARGIVGKAVSAGDLRAASSAITAGNGAIREARACLELLAELEGEISRRPEVNVTISAEWIELRSVILMALSQHPEARRDVVKALMKVDSHAVA